MLENIIINVPISPIEANYLVRNNKFRVFKSVPSGKKTTELSPKGIKEVSVWFNWGAMMSQSLTDPTCSLTAIIDSEVINENGFDYIQKEIGTYIPKVSEDVENLKRLVKLEWKINSATFVYHFTGNQINTYYKLLSGGYDLTKSKLKKIVSRESDKFGNEVYKTRYEGIEKKEETENDSDNKQIKDSNKYIGSVSLEIELKQSKKKEKDVEEEIAYIPYNIPNDRLKITIKARKKKISRICNELNLKGRDVESFLELKDSIDQSLLEYYISHITGSGDFYKFKEAEEIIMKSEFSKKEKEKMLDVLSAVGSYKGISNYLNHVEDTEPRYKSMKSVCKRQYALTVLKNIQKCGINPLTISVRTEIASKKLDNIVSIYKHGCKSKDDDNKVQMVLVRPSAL